MSKYTAGEVRQMHLKKVKHNNDIGVLVLIKNEIYFLSNIKSYDGIKCSRVSLPSEYSIEHYKYSYYLNDICSDKEYRYNYNFTIDSDCLDDKDILSNDQIRKSHLKDVAYVRGDQITIGKICFDSKTDYVYLIHNDPKLDGGHPTSFDSFSESFKYSWCILTNDSDDRLCGKIFLIESSENTADESIFKFNVGQQVVVIDDGRCYSTYKRCAEALGLSNFQYGKRIPLGYSGKITGRIELDDDGRLIYAIDDTYLIGEKGIDLPEDLPLGKCSGKFKEGTLVRVINSYHLKKVNDGKRDEHIGKIGKIVGFMGNSGFYIMIQGIPNWCFSEDNLEIIETSKEKFTYGQLRKMHGTNVTYTCTGKTVHGILVVVDNYGLYVLHNEDQLIGLYPPEYDSYKSEYKNGWKLENGYSDNICENIVVHLSEGSTVNYNSFKEYSDEDDSDDSNDSEGISWDDFDSLKVGDEIYFVDADGDDTRDFITALHFDNKDHTNSTVETREGYQPFKDSILCIAFKAFKVGDTCRIRSHSKINTIQTYNNLAKAMGLSKFVSGQKVPNDYVGKVTHVYQTESTNRLYVGIDDKYFVPNELEYLEKSDIFKALAPNPNIQDLGNEIYLDINFKCRHTFDVGDTVFVQNTDVVCASYDTVASVLSLKHYNNGNYPTVGYKGKVTHTFERWSKAYKVYLPVVVIDDRYIIDEKGVMLFDYVSENRIDVNMDLASESTEDTSVTYTTSTTNTTSPMTLQATGLIKNRLNEKYFTPDKMDEIAAQFSEIQTRVRQTSQTEDQLRKERYDLERIAEHINDAVDSKDIDATEKALAEYKKFLADEAEACDKVANKDA